MSLAHLTSRLFRNAWDLYDRKPAARYLAQSKRELSYDRCALDCCVLQRLKNILQFAYENSPHYKSSFDEHGVHPSRLKAIEDIALFPELNRADLNERLEQVTVQGTRCSGWTKSATGGTTSSPITFYRDPVTTLRRHADTETIDGWYGRRIGDRAAYIWGAPQDFAQTPSFGTRLRNLTYKRIEMFETTLDEKVMESHLERLERWRPSFLLAYPSTLFEFCQFLSSKKTRLPYLKGVSVTAEILYKNQREFIEMALGMKIFDWYGSRELGRVASECECHDGMHLNEPSVHVELVPDPALPSGCGHLVITDLWNRATPFIRYRTGDIAREAIGPCSCGRHLRRISAVEGRLVDTVVLRGGRKVPGLPFSCRLVSDASEIYQYQVVQKSLDLLVLRYVKGSAFNDKTLPRVKANLQEILEAEIPVEFEEVARLPQTASGKTRVVISELTGVEQGEKR